MTRKVLLIIHLVSTISIVSQGQIFMLSGSLVHSKVEVQNNWSPTTAVNRQNRFKGTALGSGINLNYSFRPTFFFKNKNIHINVGVGSFKQRFNVSRPFNYDSPLYPIFYTNRYTYYCWELSGGLTYNYLLGKKYFLSGDLSYSWLRSFRQEYTPTTNHGYGDLTQINRNQIDFGKILILAMSINRDLGNKFAAKLSVLIPVYTRWRNDKIFKDDPLEFSHPKFSLGASIGIAYRLEKTKKLNHNSLRPI